MTEPGFVRSLGFYNDKRKSYADMFQPLVYQILYGTHGYIHMLTYDEVRQYKWWPNVHRLAETYELFSDWPGLMHKRKDNKPLTSAELPNLHPQV